MTYIAEPDKPVSLTFAGHYHYDNVTWSEFITNANGSVIQRAGVPVEGPRKSRYKVTHSRDSATTVVINRYVSLLQRNDAGACSDHSVKENSKGKT